MYVVLYAQVYSVCSTVCSGLQCMLRFTMYVVLYAHVYNVCSTVCSGLQCM